MKKPRLEGVGPDFRIGKNGPILKQVNTSVIEVKNPADSGYGITKVADPLADEDVVTKSYAQGVVANANVYVSNKTVPDIFVLPLATPGLTYAVLKTSPLQISKNLLIAPRTGEKISFNGSVIEGTGDLLGGQLLTNGTYDTNISGWIANTSNPIDPASWVGTISWDNGRLRLDPSVYNGSFGYVYSAQQQVSGLVIGKTYRVSVDYEKTESTRNVGLWTKDLSNNILQQDIRVHTAPTGTIVWEFVASATTVRIEFYHDRGAESPTAWIDNFSLTAAPSGCIDVRSPNYGFHFSCTEAGYWTCTSMSDKSKNHYRIFGRNTWITKAALPSSRTAKGSFGLFGYMYMAGGFNPNPTIRYDAVANTWSNMNSDMPTASSAPRSLGVGFDLNNFGYVASGFDNINLNSRYDAYKNAWEAKAVGNIAYVSDGIKLGGYGFKVAGQDGLGATNYPIHRYDDSADLWLSRVSFATSTSRSAFVLDGFGYAVNGFNPSALAENWQYSDFLAALVAKRAVPQAKYGPCAFSLHGVGFSAGGNNNSGAVATNYEYNPSMDLWEARGSLNTARWYMQGVVVNGYGYCSGGSTAVHEEYN